MTKSQATAEVFVTAFKSLPKRERGEVLARLTSDRKVKQDLMDLFLLAERRREKSRPLNQVLADLGA
jgi:hypothetical protein